MAKHKRSETELWLLRAERVVKIMAAAMMRQNPKLKLKSAHKIATKRFAQNPDKFLRTYSVKRPSKVAAGSTGKPARSQTLNQPSKKPGKPGLRSPAG